MCLIFRGNPTGTYGFAYDNMGRLIGTTTQYSFLSGTNLTNSYAYDAASNRTGYTAPDSSTNTYTYDTLNRLTTLANSWAGSFGFSYDALSRRTQMTRPNGVSTSYSYDNLSRLLSVLHQLSGSTIDGAVYTVDSAGNRTSKADDLANVMTNYGYDSIRELLQATQGSTTTESYGYDPVGNRLSSLGVSSYADNSSNELTATSNASYTYDYNGNTTSKTDSTGTTNYSWDYENRLTSVTLPNSGGTVTFKYDPFGRRVYKSSGASATVYAYDGDNVVETTDQTGAVVSRFEQGENIDGPLAQLQSAAINFYEADGLGSVTSLTNGAGAVAQSYTYDSFGKSTGTTGSLANPFQYTAREFDTETGLYYYRARYYDPQIGRFISEDPPGFKGGINFYAYVQNSPTRLSDPLGLCPPKNEVPQDPCKYAGENPGPAFWAARGADAEWNPLIFYKDARYGFAIGGYLDAQPMATGTVYERAAYGNYVFGAYMAAAGVNLQDALAVANDVAWWHSRKNPGQYAGRNMDSNFPALPTANVSNITAGYNAEENGTLRQKLDGSHVTTPFWF